MIYLTDIFAEVVSRVNAEVLQDLQLADASIQEVYYMYGNPIEIGARLANENLQYVKYPLVILFTDLANSRGAVGYDTTTNTRLAIVNLTEHNYIAEERIELNFKPILHPIYESLLMQIDQLVYGYWKVFDTGYGVEDIDHTQTDRLFWGAAEADKKNPFNDRLDAVEIQINLKVYEKNC